MARGCSDSDSEEERHDRFKSERNPTSGPPSRANIPASLESYLPRARSPSRPGSLKTSRHRSRYSEERKRSPHRRVRSRDRTPRENDKRSSSREYKDKHRRKRSSDHSEPRKKSKEADDKYVDNSKDLKSKEHKHRSHRDRKRSSREKDRKVECIKRRKSRDEVVLNCQISAKSNCQDISSSDKSKDSDSSVCIKSDEENGVVSDVETLPLPRYYEIVDECAIDSDQKSHSDDRNSKKHKKTKTQEIHDSKKRKKEKKHKRKHEKRKSGSESDSKEVEDKSKVPLLSSSNEPACDPPSISKEPNEENVKDDIVNNVKVQEDNNEQASGDHSVINRPNSEQEEGELSGSESEQYFGPALPPGKNAEKVYGPMRPSGEELYGPALPPASTLPDTHVQEDEDDEVGDVIGPLPTGHESNTQSALDARASLLKYHMENKTDEENQTKREAWMTELPEARRVQIGLGPRKFRSNAAPDMSDRSSWSDTPQDKLKKLLTDESTELDTRKLEIIEKNKEMELLAKKSEKKSKSLVEMHQKELKKKKKKEKEKDKDKKPERRPFSREIDLHANIIDEAKTKSVIKRAQLLDTRFSSGESKYL